MKVIEKQSIDSIMTKDLVKLNTTDTLFKAKEIFNQYNIRHLPVISSGKLVGILSYTDLSSLEYGETFADDQTTTPLVDMLKVHQIMKPAPKSASPDMKIEEASQILIESKFHALPVIENGELVGILTTTDIIQYFLDQTK
jgi:CBS domain-containing protein